MNATSVREPPVDLRRLRHVASAAVAMASPGGPALALPPFRTAAAARAWLDVDLPALLAGAAPDDPDALIDLGRCLFRLERCGEARSVFTRVLALSRARGDRSGEGAALHDIGACHQREGHHLLALAWLTEAYWVWTRAGCEPGRADAARGMRAAADALDRRR